MERKLEEWSESDHSFWFIFVQSNTGDGMDAEMFVLILDDTQHRQLSTQVDPIPPVTAGRWWGHEVKLGS